MVGESLVVARCEGGIHCVDCRALPAFAEHLVEHAEVQRIDSVIVIADLFGDAHVFGAKQLGELSRDLHVELAELHEGCAK